MEIFEAVPWRYWLMAGVTIVAGILAVRSTGSSLCLEDCPECGEPAGTNDKVCRKCYQATAESQIYRFWLTKEIGDCFDKEEAYEHSAEDVEAAEDVSLPAEETMRKSVVAVKGDLEQKQTA